MKFKFVSILSILLIIYLINFINLKVYAVTNSTSKYLTDPNSINLDPTNSLLNNNVTTNSSSSVTTSSNAITTTKTTPQTINNNESGYSKRITNQQNTDRPKDDQLIKRNPDANYENYNKPSLKFLEIPTAPNNYFNQDAAPKSHNNTFRLPILGLHFFSNQTINDGRGVSMHSEHKSDTSIGGSYLYNLASRFRLGPEILQTNFNNTSDIVIGDTFSFMLRGEFVLYQAKSFSIYGLAGAGVSINQLNLVYTTLNISNNQSDPNAYKQIVIKPIINGTSVPNQQPYFYCNGDRGLTYDQLTTNILPDATDPTNTNKGNTVFTGKGSGFCIYSNTDDTSSYTVNYQNYLVPITATSIPWFLGVGVDYNLTSWLRSLFAMTSLDEKMINQNSSEIGLSFTARYFDNGTSRVEHREAGNPPDQYTVRYNGYLDLGFSIYLRI